MKSFKYLKNVATLELHKEKCTNCKMCMNVCPHHVFSLQEGSVLITTLDNCMECGACMKNCAFDAITVSPGVGCAAAIIKGMLTGSEPSCDCSDSDCC